MVKNPPNNAGDTGYVGSIPGSGRSPEVGSGNPLQYSCLGNSKDRGAWQCPVHVVTQLYTTEQLSTHHSAQFCSDAQSCPTLCHPWTVVLQAPKSITNSQSLFTLMSIESVMPSNHLILCCPLLLQPSVLPSIQGLFQ